MTGKMDKNVLLEYADVQEEIKDLRSRIAGLDDSIRRLEKSETSDTVSCGKKGKKTLGTVKISGVPSVTIHKKRMTLAARKALLLAKEAELLELSVRAEDYVNGIKNSELRQILRYRFLDGFTYGKTAAMMNRNYGKKGRDYTEDGIRKKIERNFNKKK